MSEFEHGISRPFLPTLLRILARASEDERPILECELSRFGLSIRDLRTAAGSAKLSDAPQSTESDPDRAGADLKDGETTPSADFVSVARRIRQALGITQVEMARLLGCTQNSVSRYEKGQYNPSVLTLRKLLRLATTEEDSSAVLRSLERAGAILPGVPGLAMGDSFASRSLPACQSTTPQEQAR